MTEKTMRRRLISACVFVIVTISAASGFAYNKPAHKVSGVIAYDVLSRKSPETVEKIITLLKQHPYYEEHWTGELESLPAANRDCGLFMLAAEWPDVVRSDKKHTEYNHPKWHYTDEPFKPAGQPESVKTLPPDEDNIMAAYEQNLAVLKNESETPRNRAIALCWIFHLIGDIHQPCHTTSLFTTEYPEGDKGGNLVFIKTGPDAAAMKLHWFWDDVVLESEDLNAALSRAIELQKRPEFARSKLTELDAETSFEEWKDASVKLAEKVVYCNGKMTGGPSKQSAPVLAEDYIITAKATGERQIVLAGYRMADVMEKSVQFGLEHFASASLKQSAAMPGDCGPTGTPPAVGRVCQATCCPTGPMPCACFPAKTAACCPRQRGRVIR
ncbi:MAG: S1/P1 nuclease [Thermoguttaceae bacterium]